MRSLSILLTFLILSSSYLIGKNDLRTPDIRSVGLGGNEVTQSIQFNPSLLALYEKKHILIHYFNIYGIKELNNLSGIGMIPNTILPVGFHFSMFGYEEYKQFLFRLLLSKRLHKQWTLGVSIQYSLFDTILFEERNAWLAFDIGLTWSPVDNLLVELLIMNLPTIFFNKEKIVDKSFMGYKMQMGFEWIVLNNLLIFMTGEHNNVTSFTGNIGLEYIIEDFFFYSYWYKNFSPLSYFRNWIFFPGFYFRCFSYLSSCIGNKYRYWFNLFFLIW